MYAQSNEVDSISTGEGTAPCGGGHRDVAVCLVPIVSEGSLNASETKNYRTSISQQSRRKRWKNIVDSLLEVER